MHKLRFVGIMLKKDLRNSLFTIEIDGYEYKEAEENEIKYIGSHKESLNYEVYKYRLSKGHICFCAKLQNEVMCYIWISPKICGLFFGTENELEILDLNDNQVYSYDLYTYKKYRNIGIASKLQNFTSNSLIKRGVTERVNIISPSNIASMKIALRAGFEPQRVIYIFGIKKYKKVFLGTKNKSNRLKHWKKMFENSQGVKNSIS